MQNVFVVINIILTEITKLMTPQQPLNYGVRPSIGLFGPPPLLLILNIQYH